MTDPAPETFETPSAKVEPGLSRLNWGCGDYPEPGWVNSDIKDGPGIDVSCDIRQGLPFVDNTFEYAFTSHALPEIPYPDLGIVLAELRRVLKRGGTLRLVLPDLDRGIRAYLENDRDYFLVPDEDAETIGGKLITQLVWYGWSRTPFTMDFTEELLRKAGFATVQACRYRETKSQFPEIVELDSRERESLFVEATK